MDLLTIVVGFVLSIFLALAGTRGVLSLVLYLMARPISSSPVLLQDGAAIER